MPTREWVDERFRRIATYLGHAPSDVVTLDLSELATAALASRSSTPVPIRPAPAVSETATSLRGFTMRVPPFCQCGHSHREHTGDKGECRFWLDRETCIQECDCKGFRLMVVPDATLAFAEKWLSNPSRSLDVGSGIVRELVSAIRAAASSVAHSDRTGAVTPRPTDPDFELAYNTLTHTAKHRPAHEYGVFANALNRVAEWLKAESARRTSDTPPQGAERVTRFEVIDHRSPNPRDEDRGRVYVANPCCIELSRQDEGQTLKVFVTDRPASAEGQR